MIISMIVAYGNNNEIGLDNKMLWHISEDFKHFKQTTLGHHLIMGRKTFDSIGRALPGRTTIVLTRNPSFSHPDVQTAKSIDEALRIAKDNGDDEVFIAGGANIYEQFLPIANRLYLSEIDFTGEADTYFPRIDFKCWKEILNKSFDEIKGKSPKWDLKILDLV